MVTCKATAFVSGIISKKLCIQCNLNGENALERFSDQKLIGGEDDIQKEFTESKLRKR